MSNDLISRKDVIKQFEETKEKAGTLRDIAYLTGVLAIIDCIPTAYDVDAVCEQMDKASDYYETDEQGKEHVRMLNLTDAIEIVKNGGNK